MPELLCFALLLLGLLFLLVSLRQMALVKRLYALGHWRRSTQRGRASEQCRAIICRKCPLDFHGSRRRSCRSAAKQSGDIVLGCLSPLYDVVFWFSAPCLRFSLS